MYFFHKQMDRNNIRLISPGSKFDNIILKRITELNFLGAMINETLNWQSRIKLVESKISINLVILFIGFKGSQHLNKKFLSMIYFSFIHSI